MFVKRGLKTPLFADSKFFLVFSKFFSRFFSFSGVDDQKMTDGQSIAYGWKGTNLSLRLKEKLGCRSNYWQSY